MSNTQNLSQNTQTGQRVKCRRCRGLGEIAWLGGVMRECAECQGSGKITLANVSQPVAPTVVNTKSEETVSLVAAAKKEVTPVELDVKPVQNVVDAPKVLDSKGREIIFPGYDNDLMEAVLAEPKMTTQQWKERYKNIPGVVEMGLRERASIRELYAMSKPAAPRKVDLLASQDKVASTDAEYQKQLKKEQLAAKKNG